MRREDFPPDTTATHRHFVAPAVGCYFLGGYKIALQASKTRQLKTNKIIRETCTCSDLIKWEKAVILFVIITLGKT